MFGIFKKEVSIVDVVNFHVTQVDVIKDGIDESAIDGGFYSSEFILESYALSFIIGIYIIQISKFNDRSAHRLSASFTGVWADKLVSELPELEFNENEAVLYLQNKLTRYSQTCELVSNDTDRIKMFYFFMIKEINEEPSEHTRIVNGMGKGICLMISAMTKELNKANKEFKLK